LLRDAIVGDAQGALAAAGQRAGTPTVRAQVVADAVMSVLGSGPRESASAEDRDALFDAWLEALDALAGGRPQTWLAEDVHWAGGDVLAFLALAGQRRPAAGGRLVIATCRPSLLETNPEWTTADGDAGRHLIQLGTLPATDAAALVRALVGDALAGSAGRTDRGTLGWQLPVHRGAAANVGQRRHASAGARRGRARLAAGSGSGRDSRCRPVSNRSTPPSSTTCPQRRGCLRDALPSPAAAFPSMRSSRWVWTKALTRSSGAI
jgi:hypothetical protein